MKFLIDFVEVKTVIEGAVIQGSTNLVSREATFSYVYNPDDSDFPSHLVMVGSIVLIQNDDNKNIFRGFVKTIRYNAESKLVEITAQDELSALVNQKIKGRFKGNLIAVIKKVLGGFNINLDLILKFVDELNIISFGELSIYDVIFRAIQKVYDGEFKIHVDGNSKLKILFPLIANCKGDFIIGKNIISSSFSANKDNNLSVIEAIGDDEVTSGSIIRVLDPDSGLFGYFTVEKDRHTYEKVHKMRLELKERKF